jgi:DNA-binding winged helix-turn-helix (wHTH) protein/Tol biopolymer transport system component
LDGNGRLQFGDFELDSQSGKLVRDGVPVKIQPQPLRVLRILAEKPGEIVTREELRARIWGDATFVEFDQGLNYCIRQVRLALGDGASEPRYIETLPKQGYRLIATVRYEAAEPPVRISPDLAVPTTRPAPKKRLAWQSAAIVCAVLAIAGLAIAPSARIHPGGLTFTQLTDFTDSAVAPALSPDGRMLAFIRGPTSFLSADQIYVKMLPDGEAKRLTDDPNLKYHLAFSPDGSQIAYTILQTPNFATYTVSTFGGESHLLLKNAAGLSWLDRSHLLFSQARSGGIHLGVVTGTVTREDFRELYFPPNERAMAHYSYPSPNRKSALVVEMDAQGGWAPCVLISLNGRPDARTIGPRGACLSAAWSPDGSWMYFAAEVNGQEHLWRQRFPDGQPEQITFGPTEEDGIAMERDGRSLITSMGLHESAIWIHDADGERSLSSEGEIMADVSPPSFSADDKFLYYLLRRTAGADQELWRMTVDSGQSEPVFPDTDIQAYDVSPDGKQVVYCTGAGMRAQLWLAAIDRSASARRIGTSGESSPHFGPHGQVLFQITEGTFNYLEQMNPDGSGRSKVVPYPISNIQGVSPGRRWVMAIAPHPDGSGPVVIAIPADGGPFRRMCESYCAPVWSSNGKFLYLPVEAQSRTGPGRSLAIPVGPGETLPDFPPVKPLAQASAVPGSLWIKRASLVPGRDPSHFAYVKTSVQRNLYRITLP